MSESDSQPSATKPPAVEALQQASDGLLFPSETDAPFEPVFWPGEQSGSLSPDQVRKLAGAPEDAAIKSVKLDTFFRPATKGEDWHNEEEKAQVKRFQEVVRTIKDTLQDVKVFRVGETEIDVYIMGKTEGGYAGLKTKVVET